MVILAGDIGGTSARLAPFEPRAGGLSLPWLERPPVLAAFLDKGRLRPLLEDTPVRVVMDGLAGLTGAARRALEPIS